MSSSRAGSPSRTLRTARDGKTCPRRRGGPIALESERGQHTPTRGLERSNRCPFNLRNRSFVEVARLHPRRAPVPPRSLGQLKAAKYGGYEQQRLAGKNIALIFEKTSTRTRCAFEVAAYDQGAHVTYLGPSGSQIGHKESMKDTARVLGGCTTRSSTGASVRRSSRSSPVRRRPGVERAHGRVPPDADPRRHAHDDRAHRQAARARSRTATWATPATTSATR